LTSQTAPPSICAGARLSRTLALLSRVRMGAMTATTTNRMTSQLRNTHTWFVSLSSSPIGSHIVWSWGWRSSVVWHLRALGLERPQHLVFLVTHLARHNQCCRTTSAQPCHTRKRTLSLHFPHCPPPLLLCAHYQDGTTFLVPWTSRPALRSCV